MCGVIGRMLTTVSFPLLVLFDTSHSSLNYLDTPNSTVFSHASTVVQCQGCATALCQPTGGKAKLTEGECCYYYIAVSVSNHSYQAALSAERTKSNQMRVCGGCAEVGFGFDSVLACLSSCHLISSHMG